MIPTKSGLNVLAFALSSSDNADFGSNCDNSIHVCLLRFVLPPDKSPFNGYGLPKPLKGCS